MSKRYSTGSMKTYSDSLKSVIDESIINRGIRLYLEGGISSRRNLLLDSWREYTVIDSRGEYTVTIPVAHLLISPSQYDKLGEAILESASCTCSYVEEQGVCKHIACAYAQLDQEYKLVPDPQVEKPSMPDSVLSTMFEAEIERKTRQWLQAFDTDIHASKPGSLSWVRSMMIETAQKSSEYISFHQLFIQKCVEVCKDWDTEKKLIPILKEMLRFSNTEWVETLLSLTVHMDSKHVEEVVFHMWLLVEAEVLTDSKDIISKYISSQNPTFIVALLEKLQAKFPKTYQMWVRFCLAVGYRDWLEQHISLIQPLDLLEMASRYEDIQSTIEKYLYGYVQARSDFLKTGDYDEIITLFHEWEHVLGRTDYFLLARDYIIENHPKKKKLINELDIR